MKSPTNNACLLYDARRTSRLLNVLNSWTSAVLHLLSDQLTAVLSDRDATFLPDLTDEEIASLDQIAAVITVGAKAARDALAPGHERSTFDDIAFAAGAARDAALLARARKNRDPIVKEACLP